MHALFRNSGLTRNHVLIPKDPRALITGECYHLKRKVGRQKMDFLKAVFT